MLDRGGASQMTQGQEDGRLHGSPIAPSIWYWLAPLSSLSPLLGPDNLPTMGKYHH